MKKIHKQFVLLSGGLDSATILAHAINQFPNTARSGDDRLGVEAVSIDYGQRHSKELLHAAQLCEHFRVDHFVLPISKMLSSGTMLTDAKQALPDASYADLPHGISPTYVPFRNGLMLSMLAAHAQKWVMQFEKAKTVADSEAIGTIYIGAHSEDAANDAYPDCSPAFLKAMGEAVQIGTYNKVFLEAPFGGLTKAQIVRAGQMLKVPFDLTWSCYKGAELHCGTCPTCRARKEAFKVAGVPDPTQYAS